MLLHTQLLPKDLLKTAILVVMKVRNQKQYCTGHLLFSTCMSGGGIHSCTNLSVASKKDLDPS